MTATARRLAVQALVDVFGAGKYTNLVLQQVLRKARPEARDRALCTELVYGTVQRTRSVDALIQPYCHRKLQDLDARVLTILRMTIYQLAFLTRIPDYAAVNDAVELCKTSTPKAAGFVNGVLRAYMRDKRPAEARLQELAEQCSSFADASGLLHSYPTWMVESWEREFGQARTLKLLDACNRPSSLSVRVNPMRANRGQVLAELQTEGDPVAEPSLVSPMGIRFGRGTEVEHLGAYREGRVTVQDEGAMLIAPLLQAGPHSVVLDLCAGLGTKTTQIAELQGDLGRVDACDIHRHKLQMMRDAADRLGLTSIHPVLSDARFLPAQPMRRSAYDAVLLDAPCSGLGVLRHRPDIRWRRQPQDVAALTDLQAELLTAALNLVRPGGVVVYATCTLLADENRQVIERVLQECHGMAEWDSIAADIPAPVLETAGDTSHGLLLTPEQFETDGFYMARLRRRLNA